MNFPLLILSITFFFWAYWYIPFMTRVFNKNLKYLTEPKVNLIKSHPSGARYDAINISRFQTIYIGVFIVPIKFLSAITFLMISHIITFIIRRVFGVEMDNNQIPRGSLYNNIIRVVTPHFWIRGFLFCIGLTKLDMKKHSLYDFLADYRPIQENQQPGMIISNHCTWMDMLFLMTKNISYFSKKGLANSFVFGNFAIAKQSLFVDRNSKKEKSKIFGDIKKRVELSKKKVMPPVLIFPEGTVANGHVLIKFKKGGFCHSSPVKIYGFRMNFEEEYIFNWSNMNPVISLIISLSQFSSSMEFHEIEEPLDPLWVAEKHGVSIEDPKFWEIFAEECKEILSFMLDLQKVETGFQELREFEEMECRKFDDLNVKLFNRVDKSSDLMKKKK